MSIDQRYILDSGEEIICLEVVRSLPGKRLVFLGEYAGAKVFVKQFLDPSKRERHWRRELDGLDAFKHSRIPTADVLYAGRTADQCLPVIVLEQLARVKSVNQAWSEADTKSREQILKRMVVLLARHHRSGLCQTDLHLDNFVLDDQEIFSLDGAGVVVHAGGIDQETGLQNLGLFVAQLLPDWESYIPEIYELYSAERGWSSGPGSDHLLIEVQKAREWRWKGFRKKLFRNCTAFSHVKNSDSFHMVAREYAGQEMSALLQDLDASFPGRGQALKNGNTCTVWATVVNGQGMVIKRYNVKDFLHGVKLSLFTGRGARSWVSGYRLLFYGIPTPQPVALLKREDGLLNPTAYLIAEQLQAVDATEWFRDPAIPAEEKGVMAEKVAQILGKLQRHQISHGDMKATNILIADGEAVLIDLDSMQWHTDVAEFEKAWLKDIKRFMQNWDDDRELYGLFRKQLESKGINPSGLDF